LIKDLIWDIIKEDRKVNNEILIVDCQIVGYPWMKRPKEEKRGLESQPPYAIIVGIKIFQLFHYNRSIIKGRGVEYYKYYDYNFYYQGEVPMIKKGFGHKIFYVVSLVVGIPLGYSWIPDKTSILGCIWYPIMVSFFVACALMIVRGIFEEYIKS
jgi:hypothetical protein